jgi:hypothetical protein
MRRMRFYMVGAGAVAVLALLLGGSFWMVSAANQAKAEAEAAKIAAVVKAEQEKRAEQAADQRKLKWGLEGEQDAATLATSFAANNSIRNIQRTGKARPRADTVYYFLKSSDPGLVRVALSDLGFPLTIQSGQIQNATNAVAAARATDIDNVKLVALALLRAGVKLQHICRTRRARYGDHVIQVLGMEYDGDVVPGDNSPTITVEQVQSLAPGRETVQCDR